MLLKMALEYHYLNEKGHYRLRKRGQWIAQSKFIFILILALNINLVNSSETNVKNETKVEDDVTNPDISKQIRVIEAIAGKSFFSDVYKNGTFRTGNNLWDDILNKCMSKPSVSCVQKNVYSYLDDRLAVKGDVDVVPGVCFKKNNVDINKYSKEANVIYLDGSSDEQRALDEENEIDEDDEPESPLEEVTDALYDKGVKFIVSHDLQLKLPETMFHGSILRISSRALTKTGALVHIDIEPSQENGQGRLFFNKIKKYIKKKLLTAFIAIVLVVKLIALKLFFVLPLIMGVTTAKKIFLKLLLFIFPALSHIFKLCSWYHQNYHHTNTKHHHHHHLIHHKPHHPPPVYGPPHGHSHSTIVVRPHSAGPPNLDHHHHHSSPPFEHYPQDWELSGPGLGNEYVASGIHRNAIANFKPDPKDVNDINSWGLGLPPGFSAPVGEYSSNNLLQNGVQSLGQKMAGHGNTRPYGPNPHRTKKKTPIDPNQDEKEALVSHHHHQQQQFTAGHGPPQNLEIRAASLAAKAPPSPIRDEILRVSAAKLQETNRIKAETELVRQQQQIISANDPETIAAEKFYGALMDKVDKILQAMGAKDPECRERAVCLMYRDPFKHAPYSNLVSNELSKDSKELIPAGDSKMAQRYYAYVQAARDGQEGKECLSLYPKCNVEYKK